MSDGLCGCGCGGSTSIATTSDRNRGLVKGQPLRYINGHARRGQFKPGATYKAIHRYLNIHFPKTRTCEQCGSDGKTDYSLIHGRQHSRSRQDYRELCRGCHMEYDMTGELNPNAKFTDAIVRDIRRRVAMGESQRALAQELGVTRGAIGHVVRGTAWRHVQEESV